MPITLYGLDLSPPVMSVMVTAKLVGVDIDFKEINLLSGDHLTEDYKKINPAHSIPAIDDNGYHIWESRAILGYLVHQYGKADDTLYPKEPKAKGKVDNMLYFDVGALYSSFVGYFYKKFLHGLHADEIEEEKVKDRLSILNTILADKEFVALNHLTVADIAIRCSLLTPKACGYNLEAYPNIIKWITHVEEAIPFLEKFIEARLKQLEELCKNGLAKSSAK